jgi:REP element-mobilizing transposase RayT
MYHVIARGNDRRLVFHDVPDRQVFISMTAGVCRRERWQILNYCLMGTHVHLLVVTSPDGLADGMRWLCGRYAVHFNRRYDRVGHLWHSRFTSRAIRDERHVLAAMRYIARNPVTAGLCDSPDAWIWSGHRALIGLRTDDLVDVEDALARLHPDVSAGRRVYEDLVGASRPGTDAAVEPSVWRPSIETVLARHPGPVGAAIANVDYGYSSREIAVALDLHPTTAARHIAIGRREREPPAAVTVPVALR